MFKPKAIIFDLGGVIINLNYNSTSNAFKKLGISDFDEVYSKQKQGQLFDDFEKGIISTSVFREALRKHLPQHVSDEAINQAWNAMLLDIPAYRIQWLQEVAKRYPIFLLSNTNEIHIEAFTNILMHTYGKNVFETLFNKVYYSCRMQMRKPDAEIFDYVLSENKLIANQTLFIDDSKNIWQIIN